MSGNSVLIRINKNKSLIFTAKEELITLEKSIFLGGNKILDNTCLTISGNLVNKDKTYPLKLEKIFNHETKIKNALISVSDKTEVISYS